MYNHYKKLEEQVKVLESGKQPAREISKDFQCDEKSKTKEKEEEKVEETQA